jgi:uncharacterized Tic20 family protein
MLAHVLGTFSGFIGPLVIYFAKRRESRFVSFHALQALVWHLSLMFVMFGVMIVFFVSVASGAMWATRAHAVSGPPSPPNPAIFLGFVAIWGLLMLFWLVNVGFAIYLGVKSSGGRWARYPLVGSLIRRWGDYAEAID